MTHVYASTGRDRQLTKELADLVVSSHPEKDAAAMDAARLGILDFLAASLAAREDAGLVKLWSIAEAEGGRAQVPVIGQQRKASFLAAALLNGYIGHALDFDDVHSDVRGHPSTVILPALLSVAAVSSVSGQRFLAAYVIGVEVMARLGRAIGDAHYLKGWHNTSTLGVIAAAVAAGYAKGFSAEQLQKAIGFAATQASGLRAQFGTETKPLHAGLAAQSALLAVRLAEADFGGSSQALDGKHGFFAVYGDPELANSVLLQDWGASWRIVSPGLWFKIYPFCSAAHHAADAAVRLAARHTFTPDELAAVRIIFPPKGDAALVEKEPRTGEQGRFSAEYVVSLALHRRSLSLESFTAATIDADILAFLPRVQRAYDSEITPVPEAVPKGRFTIVEITTKAGQVYRERVDRPRGAPGNALTAKEVQQKLADVLTAAPTLAERLTSTVDSLASEADMTPFLTLLG
ncbi:MmgE/PrpD family protein [Brevibacillus gelatini]|uniref:MmgE/PrpD family protein n=1 Tax=Brevibacillus gelatini TaxID=1655277 RepID=UPI003D81379C